MKVKAYQVAPEYQESPLYLFDEVPEGLEIYGNRNYIRRTSAKFDEVLDCLEYGDFCEFGISGYKAERLEELCNKYGTRGADDEGIIAEALSIVTGQKWEYRQISGSCQSDWNYIYYRISFFYIIFVCYGVSLFPIFCPILKTFDEPQTIHFAKNVVNRQIFFAFVVFFF